MRSTTPTRRISTTFPVVVLLATLTGCRGTIELAPDDSDQVLAHQLLDAPDPSQRGPFAMKRLFYGSGTDKNRPEYRDSVAFTTEPVDASKLISLGSSADSRNEYWGFKPDSFPLNARVWYPDGEGPFPLVLVAHGNHNMKDFSDPGYGYLGELLASRGIILASLDMNFVNGSARRENDARGWLFLKHFQAWRDFTESEDNPLFRMVDWENLAVMGHSRGGEAVGHAAAFNRLTHYPDDANLTFDFGFDIKSVIAIAPVDGQYLPADQRVPVENVNYFTFHGTHDGDVTTFHGLRQYGRVRFTDDNDWFKVAVYVHRANHGQWNTVWGAQDNGPRSGRILDLRGLLDPEDQRRFAEIYVSAFLEATLKGDDRYLPIFRDHRVIGGWLPKTMYITRFHHSSFRPVATFEEDIDVTSGSVEGVVIGGDSLSTWREGVLKWRYRTQQSQSNTQENQAVWLGWNNKVRGKDTTEIGPPAAYSLALPTGLASDWRLSGSSTLDLLLTATDATPGPRKSPEAQEEGEEQEEPSREEQEEEEEKDEEEEDKPPIDLSVQLTDARGAQAKVPLSLYGAVRRPWKIRIMRRDDREFSGDFETVLQSFSIPLEDFLRVNSRLDLSSLSEITFLFDVSEAGTVILDDVGFSDLGAAFLAVSAADSVRGH